MDSANKSARDVMAEAAFDCGRKYLKGEPTEYSNKATREMADFQLAALAAAGYAVMPVEPTLEMIEAGRDVAPDTETGIGDIWRAMLAQAPKP